MGKKTPAWRKRNNEDFQQSKNEFLEFAASSQIRVRTSKIGPNSLHVMIEDGEGNRLADFWPSTMRVNLCVARRMFFVEHPIDAIRSAIHGTPIGETNTSPGRPLEYDEASRAFRDAIIDPSA